MAAPRRKPENRRQRRNKPKAPERVGLSLNEPDPPPNLHPVVASWWSDLWQSPIADMIRKTQLPALRRLFINYDELERTRAMLYEPDPPEPTRQIDETWYSFMSRVSQWNSIVRAKGRMLPTGRGGMQLNPLLRYMRDLEQRITAQEDRFGFSLRAHQELGLNIMRARSLKEQNDQQQADSDKAQAKDSKQAPDDPRAALLVSGSDGRRS